VAGFGTSARTGLIWLAGLALAGFSGMAAFSSVTSGRVPLAAVGVTPENGQVFAAAGDAILKRAIKENKGALPETIPQASVDFALRAFAIEPLAVEALRIVALARAAEGETDEARRIMRLIPPLSKREAATNVWLSSDYARQGQEAEAFAFFDMTLRVSDSTAPLLIPPLVKGLEREELRAPLAKLLRAGPPWEGAFWIEAVRRPEVALPAMRLRMDLGRKGDDSLAVDRGLIANLVEDRKFAEALVYYRFLNGTAVSKDLTFEFERVPTFPPLDWELLADGDFSASIQPEAGKMLISAGESTRGTVARRLVLLEPGNYRTFVAYETSLPDDVTVSLSLRCGEAASEPIRSEPFQANMRREQVVSLSGDCQAYLLDIAYANTSPNDAVDILIETVSLSRIP
jgi:hypothetical protein